MRAADPVERLANNRKDLNIGYNSRFGSDPSRQFPEEGMPIYEYRCEACGHKLEALQKLSDSPLTDCPVCGKSRLSKLVTAAGFQLKRKRLVCHRFQGLRQQTGRQDR